MQLEFHQLNLQWEHLRVREPHRQLHLLASLAESGQQTPIVVVTAKEANDRYLVIDGHNASPRSVNWAATPSKPPSGPWAKPKPCCCRARSA